MTKSLFLAVFAGLLSVSLLGCVEDEQIITKSEDNINTSEALKKSLVYLSVSAYSYEMLQPWRSADLVEKNGYACAVGPYEVLTTSLNLTNAALIRARVYGQNEYISAKVKVIDYECNLCLLQLDKETMSEPLVPITFNGEYEKGAEVESFWLSPGGDMIEGRGYLDRAVVNRSPSSYARFLDYVAASTMTDTGKGRLFSRDGKPIGIACWANADKQETGITPPEVINHFLKDAADGDYDGFGSSGFSSQTLLDPTLRKYLGMPEDMKHGVYVRKVHKLGTAGEGILHPKDCLLAIDGKEIDSRGRYMHPEYEQISYHHLIASHDIGDTMTMKIFRDGQEMELEVLVVNFKASDMLIPYYEYGKSPEYIVTGGYVIQKVTRDYMQIWGDNWSGKVPPHLYQYYRSNAFNPTDKRKEIVILSYVLPAPINLGYQGLGRLIISQFNGMEIVQLSDIPVAQKLNPDSKFDIIEFEQDTPTVVIPRQQLQMADDIINKNYGITNPVYLEQ